MYIQITPFYTYIIAKSTGKQRLGSSYRKYGYLLTDLPDYYWDHALDFDSQQYLNW